MNDTEIFKIHLEELNYQGIKIVLYIAGAVIAVLAVLFYASI